MPQDEPEPETHPLEALLRLLERRGNGTAAACYAATADGVELAVATPRFRALLAEIAAGPPAGLSPGTAAAGPAVGPAGLPPQASRVVALPRGAGWLVVASANGRRRFPTTLDSDLADAAVAAGGLIAPAATRVTSPASRRHPDLEPMIRWIEAVLGGPASQQYALLLLDLDRFRALNEVLGSAIGDQVLLAIGERIATVLGPGEQLLRLEGDRFAILTDRGLGDPGHLAERLMDCVARPMELGGRSISVQASVGIADLLRPEQPAAQEVRRAESALRRAKLEGRGRSVLHVPDIDLVDRERSRLEFDLSHAVADGQMRLAFQPYVALATGLVTGAEALLRWRHPLRGELGPASFVPLAESTGAILPLGAWTLRTALGLAVRWPEPLRLSVNISALQFHQPGFIGEVAAALASSGFPAHRLELEVTETVLMRDSADTVAVLRTLMARGIRIALDDFGTGYSALAYLSRLPHHRIKLDRSFVRDLENPATAALIRAIVASAKSQGVSVTAEGVETEAQLEAVRAMGFTHAQGYATGAPVEDPAAAFARVPV